MKTTFKNGEHDVHDNYTICAVREDNELNINFESVLGGRINLLFNRKDIDRLESCLETFEKSKKNETITKEFRKFTNSELNNICHHHICTSCPLRRETGESWSCLNRLLDHEITVKESDLKDDR